MSQKFYAHSLENQPPEKWQPLEEHLNSVAGLAAGFAEVFHAECWAEILGENHDLGKGTFPSQAYLRKANGIVDEFAEYYSGHPTHANVGAKWLYEYSKEAGKLLAYCIAGHHGGLTNWDDSQEGALKSRLQKKYPIVQVPLITPEFPVSCPFATDAERFGFQLQFFVRMLFSCLVDADYLDTEQSLDEKRAKWRSCYPFLEDLHSKFWANFNALRDDADDTEVNRLREIVLKDCLFQAKMAAGHNPLRSPRMVSRDEAAGGRPALNSITRKSA